MNYELNPVSRKYDTIRVRYTLTNTHPKTDQKAGIRLMLDTFIGDNDGVPFFIPGRQGVIDKPLTLEGKDVPDMLLALERNDLSDGQKTVAQFRFGTGDEERPGKLVLSQWPGNVQLAKRFPDQQWRAVDGLGWEWPVADKFNGDSAVGIYYAPKVLKPGEKRVFSFTYGLGSLSQGGGKSGLKLYAPGPFEAGKSFRLTAFVRNPKAGQTITLSLPQGLRLAQDETREKPVELQAGVEVTKVDWVVRADAGAGGKLELTAELSGAAITERLPVFMTNTNPALRELVVTGTPVAGGKFRLTGQVLNAKPGTTATLTLPKGLSLGKNETEMKAVPAGASGQASWVVDAEAASGEFTVGVHLSSGAEATKLVSVRAREPAVHAVVVTGTPAAGGAFRVTAQVLFPPNGASVKLALPAGLVLNAGETAEKTLLVGSVAQVSWAVRADKATSGKLPLTVQLQPGGSARTESVSVAPAVRALTVRLANGEPAARGRPFWVVADVPNPNAGDAAELQLPAGFKFADGHTARKPLAVKDNYGRAAWAVVLDADAGEAADLTVAVPGLDARSVRVTCRQGNLIQR